MSSRVEAASQSVAAAKASVVEAGRVTAELVEQCTTLRRAAGAAYMAQREREDELGAAKEKEKRCVRLLSRAVKELEAAQQAAADAEAAQRAAAELAAQQEAAARAAAEAVQQAVAAAADSAAAQQVVPAAEAVQQTTAAAAEAAAAVNVLPPLAATAFSGSSSSSSSSSSSHSSSSGNLSRLTFSSLELGSERGAVLGAVKRPREEEYEPVLMGQPLPNSLFQSQNFTEEVAGS